MKDQGDVLLSAVRGISKAIWSFTISSAAVIIGLVIIIMGSKECESEISSAKERYDELEFVVIHRPQITYFVDLKHTLCFATRKPNYKDLVEFPCPERLWKEAELKEKKKKKK